MAIGCFYLFRMARSSRYRQRPSRNARNGGTMYLSDRDLRWAIECGKLIVDPRPEKIDPSSIDLHLDSVDEARVWDIEKYNRDRQAGGEKPAELRIGKFEFRDFSPNYLKAPRTTSDNLIFRRGNEIIIKPNGFLLWQ